MRLSTFAATIALASTTFAQNNLVVPAGTTLVYDTSTGPLLVKDLTIEAGGVLRAQGDLPFHVRAKGVVRIDGLLDASGLDNPGVVTQNTTNIPEPGALGGPGGGQGGTGSPSTNSSSPSGTNGFGPKPLLRIGGRGGDSGMTQWMPGEDHRRPGGGGGGALAADQPVHPDPAHPTNIGRIVGPGKNGAPTAISVVTMTPPPRGGAAGDRAFVDADPTNDFFGRKRLGPGLILIGELPVPVAGAGGGGGGDAIVGTPPFPALPFDPHGDEKGAGGGGGGGLGIVVARRIVVGSLGRIRCDGGRGGGGENTLFLNRLGGGSGGGSGGYLILQAVHVDLSAAGDRALTALGGRGGVGKDNQFGAMNSGGDGGPGVIAIHVPRSLAPLLPAGKTLADLSAPTALVLLTEHGL